jgi:hypothetical protein
MIAQPDLDQDRSHLIDKNFSAFQHSQPRKNRLNNTTVLVALQLIVFAGNTKIEPSLMQEIADYYD